MYWGSLATPRFNVCLEELTGLSTKLYLWPRFIKEEGYTAELKKKKKAHGAKSGKNWMQIFKSPLPVETYRRCFISSNKQWWCTCERIYSIRDSGPRSFTGVWWIGTLCLAHTKIPDSQKGHRYSVLQCLHQQWGIL